jgi:hypothetical protein
MRRTLAALILVACGSSSKGGGPDASVKADAGSAADAPITSVDGAPPADGPPIVVLDAQIADGALDRSGCLAPNPATTLHVDSAAPEGGNGSDGCPFTKITEALDASRGQTGITIIVEAGVYDAERFPLFVDAGILLEGKPGGASRDLYIIDGSGAANTADGARLVSVVLAGEIDYMEITDAAGNADYVVYSDSGSPTLKLDSVSGGAFAAYRVTGGAQVTISDQGDIGSSAGDGILVDGDTTLTATGTSIHDNGGDGVHDTGAAAQVTIGYAPIACTTSPPIDPCLIYCNGAYGIEAATGTMVNAAADNWDHATPTSGAAPADVNDTGRVADDCPGGAAPQACMQ